MHIKNKIQFVGLTPIDDTVNACIAVLRTGLPHIVFIGEEFVVEGKTDGIGTLLSNKVNIFARDIVILKLLPKEGCLVRADSLFEEQVDHPGRVRTAEAEHIALRIQPVAQIRTLDIKFLSIRLYQVGSLYSHKTCWLLCNLSASRQQDNG